MTGRMTPRAQMALATLIAELRPDWGFHGIKPPIEKLAATCSPFTVARTAIAAAEDPGCITPAPMHSNPVYRPDRAPAKTTTTTDSGPSSAGRENAIRLRAEAAEAAAAAAGAHQIGAIRAQHGWARRIEEAPPLATTVGWQPETVAWKPETS